MINFKSEQGFPRDEVIWKLSCTPVSLIYRCSAAVELNNSASRSRGVGGLFYIQRVVELASSFFRCSTRPRFSATRISGGTWRALFLSASSYGFELAWLTRFLVGVVFFTVR